MKKISHSKVTTGKLKDYSKYKYSNVRILSSVVFAIPKLQPIKGVVISVSPNKLNCFLSDTEGLTHKYLGHTFKR